MSAVKIFMKSSFDFFHYFYHSDMFVFMEN